MIESIRGYVETAADSFLMIRTGPLVVSVLAPGYFLRTVSAGTTMEIPVYLHLQMEGNRVVPLLVGFPDRRDREFFEKFISVSGVGVKAAVKALEQPPDRIASAIAADDVDLLTTLPGIGKKRARQIVAGLQDQMRKMYGAAVAAATLPGNRGEARAVLRQLGITASEAEALIETACSQLEDGADTSSIVKRAMRIRNMK